MKKTCPNLNIKNIFVSKKLLKTKFEIVFCAQKVKNTREISSTLQPYKHTKLYTLVYDYLWGNRCFVGLLKY